MKPLCWAVFCLFFISTNPLQAQKLLYRTNRISSIGVGLGDINGDGFGDFAIAGSSSLDIHSGKDFSLIRQIPRGYFHSMDQIGDVNKDGVPDVVVGRMYPGSIFVYSGKDCSVIHEWTAVTPADHNFGWFVSGGGDVDADGYPDFVGCGYIERPNYMRYAIVFSGRDGAILYRFNDTAGEGLGISARIIGDLNGDGHADIILSAINANHAGIESGSVYVRSGKDGSLLYRLDGRGANMQFGFPVEVLGDVDKDGVPDFAVSSYRSPRYYPSTVTGTIEIFSGATGLSLHFLEGPNANARFGRVVRVVGDTTGDGFPELLTLSGPQNWNVVDRAVLISANSGIILRTYLPPDPALHVPGFQFIALGDVDGDGLADLGIFWYNLSNHPISPSTYWLETHAPFGTVPLQADKPKLSLSRGESLEFKLDGGLPLARHWYALLGSMSGTLPGLRIGLAHLPLQPDLYFNLTMGHGGGFHSRSFGIMSSTGTMTSTFKLNPRYPTELIGVRLNHAFLGFSVNPPWIFFGSNAVETEIGL